jgi:hypothetical protein
VELKGMKGLRMVNSMSMKGNLVTSPRRLGDRREVREGEKEESMSKIAKV